ncbi:SpdD-like protein [Streptomyces sp. NPDC051567]|uniref:SpdD-like protein n=1 Tax=Streptomyces sp. NPDC051567 TaxID=3365660 RepID=UPI0037AE9191
MIRPKIPTNPLPTGRVIPLVQPPATGIEPHHTSAVPACGCDHTPAPATTASGMQVAGIRLTPAGLVTVAAGTGAVLVIGTVLVSMLLAVAITGASVAVCAVVLRSLLNNTDIRR